ncbi:BTB and MATH domain-containing protein 38 [Toxocara canis]|uniref:BTB and MATH domain-containing protein 38 n=1 Tax=Toxocara canis TaxID=6265 RepID=A0A0B2V156_TOXCA|nr:BTB and MATH domain-containing protein 38 [Toxocara canis]
MRRKTSCSSYDFTDPCSDTADCALVVEGVKLYVSRAYLALYSPVFYAIFFAKFSGCRGKREVQLDGVILEELIELLDVIYPSHKPVTGENVEFLLKLGDRFEIQFVIDECEHFLIESDEVAIVTKLYWADQYRLVKLQDACLRQLKSINEIKRMRYTDEFREMSDASKSALLEKIFKLL